MRPSRIATFLVLLLVHVLATEAPAAQDVMMGRRIAERWCINCHKIDSDSRGQANDAIPSFPSIAEMPSTTAMSLNVFLSSSHGNMPNYSLTRSEIRDVSAYILSLRERKL